MNKKTFKDNTANIDRLFSGSQIDETLNASDTSDTSKTQETPRTQKPYRINLKLNGDFKQYLDDESWKARKSITQYINDLIQADKDAKGI